MYRSPLTLARSIALLVAVLGLAWVMSLATSANAGPYDGTTTRPGTVIINSVSATWGGSGLTVDPVQAQAALTIMPVNTPGVLRMFIHAPGAAEAMSTIVRPTEYGTGAGGTGPFLPLPSPNSTTGAPLDLSTALPLMEIDRILPGTDIFLALEDASLNLDSNLRDTVILRLTDLATGDTEYLRISETGPDTGVFTGHLCICGTSVAQDGKIETRHHSRIDAFFQDPFRGERQLTDQVLVGPVDPYGTVFDSRSGAPINGVEVTLIDDTTGAPAIVWGDDLVADYPATVVTGGTVTDSSGRTYQLDPGQFRFPFVRPGRYRFEIVPPAIYNAPSAVADADLQSLPGAPFVLGPGSRLETFEVLPGPAVRVDIPLDGAPLIDVTRVGSDDALTQGDAIRFEITAGTTVAADVVADILDSLPLGLNILRESIRVDGAAPNGPVTISPDGRSIVFEGIVLPRASRATISYIARVTPAAEEGDVLSSSSTARAPGLVSNTATHDLEILALFGSDRAIILGQIFGNGCTARFDPALDLSGIRIMTETGRFVDTDAEGLFSFPGLPAGTHVLHVDPLSLPAGYEAVLCENDTRRAGARASRFVEARGGLMSQVFFHIAPTGETDGQPRPPVESAPPAKDAPGIETFDATWFARLSNPTPGIVFPAAGHLARSGSLDIAFLRDKMHSAQVLLNGTPVSILHKRPAVSRADSSMVLEVWRGASMKEGRNSVEVVVKNAAQQTLWSETVDVIYNTRIDRLELVRDLSSLTTNGRTGPLVVLRPMSRDGLPLHPGAIVTLKIERPFAFAAEPEEAMGAAPQMRRSVVVGPDGLIRVALAPSRRPGKALFSIGTASGPVAAEVPILSQDRPWVLVGLAEGTAAHTRVARHLRTDEESSIAQIGDIEIDGRVAFYAEGVIQGKWLATMRLDSGIDASERDFFAPDPEADYIVYGDASIEGDAAQSRHKLYLRIEGERSEFLYGDFDTGFDAGEAIYTRRLTGARASWMGDDLTITAIAASTSQGFVSDSFAADGTSGPFDLTNSPLVPFSERIIVETSDRNAPDRIIDQVTLTRGTDYDIDYATGRIFLSEPVRSRTSNLDPNAIIIDYEIETGESDGLILGARAEMDLGAQTTAGVTVVSEDNIRGTEASGLMAGADISTALGGGWILRGAAAVSRQETRGAREAARDAHAAELGLDYVGDRGEAELYLRSEDTVFGIDNQTTVSEHVISAGVSGDIRISPAPLDDENATEARLSGLLRTENNLDTDQAESVAEAMILRNTPGVSRGFGLRALDRRGPKETGRSLKLVGTTSWSAEDGRLSLSLGQEVALTHSGTINDPSRGSLEANWKATDSLTFTLTNEIAQTKEATADILALGATYKPWSGTTLSLGGLHARADEAGLSTAYAGIAQDFALGSGWQAGLGLDYQSPLGNETSPVAVAGLSNPRLDEGYTAVSGTLGRAEETWMVSFGGERRLGEDTHSTKITADASMDLSKALAIGAKARLWRSDDTRGSGFEIDHEIKASVAYRPRDARFAILDQLVARRIDEGSGRRDRIVNSIFLSRQLPGGHEINLRHGIKWAAVELDGDIYDDVLTLVGGEYRHNISEWLDAGLQGAALHSMETGTTQSSAGVSLGLTPFHNGWVSLGYNITGFRDEDFSASGFTDKGAFLQFRVKFDSDSLRDLF